jgi:hypothetical protein
MVTSCDSTRLLGWRPPGPGRVVNPPVRLHSALARGTHRPCGLSSTTSIDPGPQRPSAPSRAVPPRTPGTPSRRAQCMMRSVPAHSSALLAQVTRRPATRELEDGRVPSRPVGEKGAVASHTSGAVETLRDAHSISPRRPRQCPLAHVVQDWTHLRQGRRSPRRLRSAPAARRPARLIISLVSVMLDPRLLRSASRRHRGHSTPVATA